MVPSDRVRTHLDLLVNVFGLPLSSIAEAAGIARFGLQRHLNGVSSLVSREYEAAILAVDYRPHPAQTNVLGVGTSRRVKALARAGWSLSWQAERLGYARQEQLKRLTAMTVVPAERQRAVAAMYAELSEKPGPSLRSKTWAEKAGWPDPWAWDEDTIDSPLAQPEVYERDEQSGPHIDDVRELQEQGLDDDQIATRLRCTRDDIKRARLSSGGRRSKYPPEVIAYIQSGDAFDLTNAELAAMLGIPRRTIAAIRAAARAA
jgi:hypothetical protein